MRRTGGRIIYALYLLAFVEAALQVFYYKTAGAPLFTRVVTPIYTANEHSGYRVKSDLDFRHETNEFRVDYHTNSEGFRVSERHEEYGREPAPETKRILLLGPSFAFGWGVGYDETFGTLLQEMLAREGYSPSGNVEVLNAGVPALGPRPQMKWYLQVGRLYAPDLVIQMIYGSMVRDKKEGVRSVDEKGYLRGNLREGGRLRNWVKNSAIAFYSYWLYTHYSAGEPLDRHIEGAGRELKVVTHFDLDDPTVRWGLEYYQSMARAVQEQGSSFQVVYTPLSYVIHAEDVARWRSQGARDIEAQVTFDREFCEYLSRTDIPCVDVTPDLIKASQQDGERLYFWLDVHWTPHGNEVAARAVADRLLQNRRRGAEASPRPRH